MRIRKRFPPSSSLSSLPLSDPQLSRSLVVVQVQPPQNIQEHLHGNLLLQEELKTNPNQSDHHHNPPLKHPRNQEMMIGAENPMWASPHNSAQEQILKQKEIEGKEIKDERIWKVEEEKKNSNDISVASAEVDMQFPRSSSSSVQASDWWGEGDRIVPLKKRKGSFERMGTDKEIMIKPKMKSKTNKKCHQQNGHEQENHEQKVTGKDQENGASDTKSSTTKKSKRGNVIMEGSRCSRVNGRGWRCCQQTLVGYSLCEHHLGKGRLRSMTSVRNRATAHNNIETTTARILTLLQSSDKKQDQIMMESESRNGIDEGEENGKKALISTKKRKIGAVKARSISSLLGQTDNEGGSAANGNKNSSTS